MKGLVERFSEDFIETRRRALQTFLSKTAEHPMLSRSPQLKVFLTEQVSYSLHPVQVMHVMDRPGLLHESVVRPHGLMILMEKERPDEIRCFYFLSYCFGCHFLHAFIANFIPVLAFEVKHAGSLIFWVLGWLLLVFPSTGP